MATHQSKAQKETVERVMHEFKHGELKTGGGRKVKNPKQAIAIGLHEAGASRYESKEKNRENLRRTKRRERSGATATDANEKTRSKSQLYEEARRRKIPGRSKMDKGELERALHSDGPGLSSQRRECFRTPSVVYDDDGIHPGGERMEQGTAKDANVREAVDQGKAVWQDAKASASDAIDKASSVARDVTAAGTQAAAQAGEAIQGVARQVSNQASQAATSLYEQGTNAGGQVSRYTAEQPWTALLMAAALGYGLAYLIHRP